MKQNASTGARLNTATRVLWAGLRKAGDERPGLSCNLGSALSALRDRKEGEKGVTAPVGMCLQGLLCCLSHP